MANCSYIGVEINVPPPTFISPASSPLTPVHQPFPAPTVPFICQLKLTSPEPVFRSFPPAKYVRFLPNKAAILSQGLQHHFLAWLYGQAVSVFWSVHRFVTCLDNSTDSEWIVIWGQKSLVSMGWIQMTLMSFPPFITIRLIFLLFRDRTWQLLD